MVTFNKFPSNTLNLDGMPGPVFRVNLLGFLYFYLIIADFIEFYSISSDMLEYRH